MVADVAVLVVGAGPTGLLLLRSFIAVGSSAVSSMHIQRRCTGIARR